MKTDRQTLAVLHRLAMDNWYGLKEQEEDKVHLLLGSTDISCLLGIEMQAPSMYCQR